MGKSLLIGMLGLVLLGPTVFAVEAEDPMAAELYGQGVHTFFTRDYQKAITQFNSAIQRGAQDPRDYYFRGLAYLRTGHADEAAADFKKGAQLEAAGDQWVYAVGEAIERIQGKDRLEIERYRQPVYGEVHQRAVDRANARAEQFRRSEEELLRSAVQTPAPAQAAVKPAQSSPVATVPGPLAPTPPAANPFAPEPPAGKAAAEGKAIGGSPLPAISTTSGSRSGHTASASHPPAVRAAHTSTTPKRSTAASHKAAGGAAAAQPRPRTTPAPRAKTERSAKPKSSPRKKAPNVSQKKPPQ